MQQTAIDTSGTRVNLVPEDRQSVMMDGLPEHGGVPRESAVQATPAMAARPQTDRR
jgi:hypothetical protein